MMRLPVPWSGPPVTLNGSVYCGSLCVAPRALGGNCPTASYDIGKNRQLTRRTDLVILK